MVARASAMSGSMRFMGNPEWEGVAIGFPFPMPGFLLM
ncbi:hypothetical protein CSB88_5743 [Pseudomonas aeruginosa]|nr:hypothetical protein CSB88_5743 [Pseudomonas aeruginosa]